MINNRILRTSSAALLSLGLATVIPMSTAFAADGETATDCASVLKEANSHKYQRAIILQTNSNGPSFVSDLSDQTKVVNQEDNSVTVRVPVTFYDRNENGLFDGDEIHVLVPGQESMGELQICNNGPTQRAVLNASIVNAVTSGDVTDISDPFYSDVKVNDQPFASYVGKEVTLIDNKKINRGDIEKIELKYDFDFESTSGNKAGPNAKNIKNGEPNEYKEGSRIAALDIKIDLVGIDDPVDTPEPPKDKVTPPVKKVEKPVDNKIDKPVDNKIDKGVVTGDAVGKMNTWLVISIASALGLSAAGGYVAYNKKKESK